MPDNGRVQPDRVKQCHMAPCAVPCTVVIVQCIIHNTSMDLAVKSIGRSISSRLQRIRLAIRLAFSEDYLNEYAI